MKPPVRQDYAVPEGTDPGLASSDTAGERDAAQNEEDEFPSDVTRIDNGGLAAQLKASRAPGAPQQQVAKAQKAGKASGTASRDKLAALQSLSLGAQSSARASAPARPSGGGGKLPWVLLVLVLGGLGGQWGWQRFHGTGPKPTGDGKPTVRTEVVTPTGGSGQVHMAAGYMAAQTPIAISVPVGGRIKDVKVSNGDKVKAGGLLVQLDDSAARADAVAARAELSAAESKAKQMRNLFKAGAVTAVEVSTAEGAVGVARGRLAPINQRISQTRVTSPIDGTVLERLTQPGETVNAGAPLVRIADLSHLVAEADITEADLVKIRRGQAVNVTSDASADRVYEGKVYEIAQQADRARGTVQVKVELHVPDQSLKPGMSVKCAFQPDKSAKAHIYVTRSALTPQGGVWVVGSSGTVSHRPVATVAGAGSSVEVMSGLSGGERIVADATQVHEGQVLSTGP